MTTPNTPPLSPPTPRVVETTWAGVEAALARIELVAELLEGYIVALRGGAMLHANDLRGEPERLREAIATIRLTRRETTVTVEET